MSGQRDTGIAFGVSIGTRLRALRRQGGLTLNDVAAASGISASTLSKVENDKVSPTFANLLRLAETFGLSLSEMIGEDDRKTPSTGRIAVTRANRIGFARTQTYEMGPLCSELRDKRMSPFLDRVHRGSGDIGERLVSHEGEEFIYVVSGEIEVHTAHYVPIRLGPGDSAYLDSQMAHTYRSTSDTPAEMLMVWLHPDRVHGEASDELIRTITGADRADAADRDADADAAAGTGTATGAGGRAGRPGAAPSSGWRRGS